MVYVPAMSGVSCTLKFALVQNTEPLMVSGLREFLLEGCSH